MNTFFYRRDEYERLYNCTGIDPSKIGSRNVPLGSTYITIGICLEIMYIPCMIVLCKRELRQNSCFKLMFLLGLFDMVTIVFNSIITGYFTVEGATFCSHPTFIYFCGVSVMGLWCGTCLTSIILSLNRAIELWFPRITQLLFTGWRTYLWYLPPLSYAFVMAWISKSFSFSTRGYAWYNNPYVDLPWIKIDPDQYHSITHSINNLSTVFIIPFLYIALAVSVWVRCRYLKSSKISKIQKQLTYQSCALCFFVFMADAVYVYAQYFTAPPLLVIAGHCSWIACHGSAVVIYLTCNETVKNAVFELIGVRKLLAMFKTRTVVQNSEPISCFTTTTMHHA